MINRSHRLTNAQSIALELLHALKSEIQIAVHGLDMYILNEDN